MTLPFLHLIEIFKFHDLNYIKRLYPVASAINANVCDEELVNDTMAFAQELYDSWDENKERIISQEVIEKYKDSIAKSKVDFLADHLQDDFCEYILGMCLGVICSNGNKPTDIGFINAFLNDGDWRGFFETYTPDEDVLDKIIETLYVDQKEIIKRYARRNHVNFEEFLSYYSHLKDDALLKEIDNSYFGEDFYVAFEWIYPISSILIRLKRFDKLAEVMCSYTMPQIQYQLIQVISDLDDLRALLNEIIIKYDDSKHIVIRLIINYWFEQLIKNDIKFSEPTDGKTLNEVGEIWKTLTINYNNHLDESIEDMTKSISSIMGDFYIVDWYFKKPVRTFPQESSYSRSYYKIYDLLKNKFLPLADINHIDKETANLSYLSAFAKLYSAEDISEENKLQFLHLIFDTLKKDMSFFNGNMDNMLLSKIETLACFIKTFSSSIIKNETNEFLNKNKTHFEGIKADKYKDWSDKSMVETNFIMLIMYSCALCPNDKGYKDLFEEICKHDLRQKHLYPFDYENISYTKALMLAELITTQIFKDFKDDFERSITTRIHDFPTALSILCSTDKPSEQVLSWLQCQVDLEWPIIRQRLLSRGQRNEIARIDSMIDLLSQPGKL